MFFDALTHPTLTGRWLGRDLDARFEALVADMVRHRVARACAVGLAGIEGYAHEPFIEACRRHPGLVPVAGVHPLEDGSPQRLGELRDMGFVGIKLHPRFNGFTRRLGLIGPVLKAAGDAGLVVFLCTYLHGRLEVYPAGDPFADLVQALQQAPRTRVVLVHGGDVQLMRHAELVRHNDNLLLDLSMTLLKYPGSSIDADLRFLLQSFDRRICLGSDWPEADAGGVAARLEELGGALPPDKRDRATHRNLAAFLGLET